MKRQLTNFAKSCLAAFCIGLSFAANAQAAEKCFDEFNPVKLTGTVKQKTFPGRPDFTSVANGDEPITHLVLELNKPVCLEGTSMEDEPFKLTGLKEIQLVFSETESLRNMRLAGKKITVTGKMFVGVSAWHFTKALLDVEKISGLPVGYGKAGIDMPMLSLVDVQREPGAYCQPERGMCATNQKKYIRFKGKPVCIKDLLVGGSVDRLSQGICQISARSAEEIFTHLTDTLGPHTYELKVVLDMNSDHAKWSDGDGEYQIIHRTGFNIQGGPIDNWALQLKMK